MVRIVVFMKDSVCVRNYWFIGIVKCVFFGDDGWVRKVELKVVCNGKIIMYICFIIELVVFLEL